MDTRRIGRALLAAVMALLLGVAALPSGAQTPPSDVAHDSATYSGTVTKTNPLTVAVDGRDQAVALSPGSTVLRDGQPVSAAALAVGDHVTIGTTNADNTAGRMTTAPATRTAPGFLIWLLPALLVLALVLSLAVWRARLMPTGERARKTSMDFADSRRI